MNVTAGHWAMLSGHILAVAGGTIECNPYRCGGPRPDGRLAVLWAAGWRGAHVARETVSRPGRGRGAAGPRREWSRDDLAALDAADDVPTEIFAQCTGRTGNAVRIKRARQRKESTT